MMPRTASSTSGEVSRLAARNAAKAVIGRPRPASMSCPSASIARGAAVHSSAAIAPSASSTHKNHADPDGQGPIVTMSYQKWKKLKSTVPVG